MSISTKRIGSQKTNYHQQPQNNEYDDYVYYPYYSKPESNGGYEYAQESAQYEKEPAQYKTKRSANNSALDQRT